MLHILVQYTILAVAGTAAAKTTVEAAAAAAEAAWSYGGRHRLAMALLLLTSYTNYGPTAPIPYIPTTANYGAESGIRCGSSP